MTIRSVELSDFRNYGTLLLNFDQGTNILYGDNAQGKTNILEAIFLSCTTKSHRGAPDKEMIRFGKEEAHIRTVAERDDIPIRVDMHLRASRGKGVAIDGVRMKRASAFLERLQARIIFFSPEDLDVIKKSPAGRRRFLDIELCQLDPLYLEALNAYQKALAGRAKVLRDFTNGADETLLDVYDEQLLQNGKTLIAARKRFVESLEPVAAKTHETLTGNRECIRVEYEPDCEEGLFEERLKGSRKKDLALRVTGCGPHRDELGIYALNAGESEKLNIRKFGSQGQQRTAALSLKLSEIELIKNKYGAKPVLLLDDVLSELDENRQNHLLSLIGDIQTILTCTGVDAFVKSRLTINQLFHVTNGSVTAENA